MQRPRLGESGWEGRRVVREVDGWFRRVLDRIIKCYACYEEGLGEVCCRWDGSKRQQDKEAAKHCLHKQVVVCSFIYTFQGSQQYFINLPATSSLYECAETEAKSPVI